MSKRGPGANFGGDEGRYGASHDPNMAETDKPVRATAAQMARRKIAQAKPGRRSASPAISVASAGAPNTQFQVPTQSGFNFSFGNTNTSFGQQQQNNGSPSPSLQFNPSNTPQQNSTNIFGQPNSTSFGTSFNSTSSQPQQNGFAPSTNSLFSQPQQQQSSSFQFGQSQQTQQNGATPQTSTSSIFKSFGEQNQGSEQNGSSFKFENTQPETQKPSTANIFSGFGQKSQESPNKPVFGNSQPQPSPAAQNTSNLFGGLSQSTQNNGDKTVFGTSTQQQSFSSSKAGTASIFSSLGQNSVSNGDKPLFPTSQAATEAPKSASSNLFGGFSSGVQPSASKPDVSSPLTNGLAQSQQNGTKPAQDGSQTPKLGAFAGFGSSEQQTPKPSTNVFGSSSNVSQAKIPQQDTSMTTPDRVPQQQSNTPATAQKGVSFTPAVPATSAQPRSLFDRMDDNETNKALNNTSTPLFSFKPPEQPKESVAKPLFTPAVTPMFASSAQPATSKASAEDSAVEAPKTAPAKSLFMGGQQTLQPSSQHSLGGLFTSNFGASTPKPHATPSASALTAPAQDSDSLNSKQRRKLKPLNLSLLKHLQAADLERDWSKVFNFYITQISDVLGEQNAALSSKPAASGMFSVDSAVQTPKPTTFSSNIFSKPPDTAPVTKKRLFEDDNGAPVEPPATEKRVKSNDTTVYPKLPDTASNTAKFFQATLEKPNADSSQSKSQTNGTSSQASSSVSQAPSGFRPTFSVPPGSGGDMFAAFGKAAKAQEEKDRSKRKAEDYDSDEETAEQWEKRDQEEQEQKRKKIAEAAKGSKGFTFGGAIVGNPSANNAATSSETSAAQPKSLFDRITPASPPKSAPSKSAAPAVQAPNGLSSAGAPALVPATLKPQSSLFSNLQSEPSKTDSNIFGFLREKAGNSQLAEEVEKEQGTGDKTFKPDTPLKFGNSIFSTKTSTAAPAPASSAPAFTGLFGSSTPPTGLSVEDAASAKLALPAATPFSFGPKTGSLGASLGTSLGASRATTPGVTTDGEGSTATGADDAASEGHNDAQFEDQTALQPAELKENQILFQLGDKKNALCKKYEDKGDTKGWVSKGKGPLYILKHKDTGKVRVLLKIAPFGKPAMNYEPVKGIDYKILPGSGKIVAGAFFDHLHAAEAKLGQFTIQVKERDDAEEIARILKEETPQ